MTQFRPSNWLAAAMAFAVCASIGAQPATAQFVRHADADYEASGYVTPAGMVHPSMYTGSVMPVGYYGSSCDSCGSCDGGCGHSIVGCDTGTCGSSDCETCCGIFDRGLGCGGGGGCTLFAGGGLLGKLTGAQDSCDGLSPMRHMCLFCGGDGCSACQLCSPRSLAGGLALLAPYCDAGLCAQRWYDISLEALWLRHSNGSIPGVATSQGIAGTPVLNLGDANSGDSMEPGFRVSAAMIFGAGGNLEATYIGGQKWRSERVVNDPGGQLYSFVSLFGTDPPGTPANAGFDETDRSDFQGVQNRTQLHSIELNYRRRTVGPYCRWQASCLLGLRYLRFEDEFTYSTLSTARNDFFNNIDDVHNNLFGPQIGGDLWWNAHPGINFGMGLKGAWVHNEIGRNTVLVSSFPDNALIRDGERRGAVIGEFEAKMVYRFTHSWTLRTAYYAMAVDNIAFGTADQATIRDFQNFVGTPPPKPAYNFNSLTVQGVSIGTEFMW